MKRRLITLVSLAGMLSVGFLVLEKLEASALPNEIIEQEVTKNLLRIRVHGKWQEVPLVPLAEHQCKSGDEHYERYCD